MISETGKRWDCGCAEKAQTVTRPLLRYYGGKWRIAPQIIAQFPAHDVYVEPFGGGGSVLLQKPRASTEVYNDLDGEVCNVFRQMRDNGELMTRLLNLTPFSREEFDISYEPTLDPVEAARRFIFRAAAGIGSDSAFRPAGFRLSLADGKHNTAQSWGNRAEAWAAITARLQGVIIEHRPAVDVMRAFDRAGVLHYVDPPYIHTSRRSARAKYRHEMTDADHEALAECLHGLRGSVILSGYCSPLYRRLYKDWRRVDMAARDGANNERKEVLWISPRTPAPIRECELF